MLRATAVYLFVSLYIFILGPPSMLWTWLSGDGSLVFKLARFCIRVAGWLSGVRITVSGRAHLVPGQNYLFLSNHQGNFDPPVLYHAIPLDLRAVLKQEMMRIPVLSSILRQLGFIPIDRRDPKRARESIERGAELLREGYSFFAFPEGTRSRNGKLGEFKRGVFVMALKSGAPIVPVSINNSSAILPPGRYSIRPGSVSVTLHAPIPTAGMDFEDRLQLLEATREAIASGMTDRK